MSKLAINKTAPAFVLPSTNGGNWKLSEAKGKHLVLYFYPRDNTQGCTTEATAFRDHYPQFKKMATEIIGISADSMNAHLKFKAKLALPFELLSDTEHTVCNVFEVFKAKKLYGREYMGIERSTFLIDSSGKLRHEWRKVKVPGHVEAVLTEVGKL
ncbi:MAG: peroxiredoxin [Steroidobacteraceae bacterium]